MTPILAPRTCPPGAALTRNHHPPRVRYREYRACLRWEFAFTCSICQLHESDVVRYGAEGWGIQHAEHIAPRSHDPTRSDEYANILFVCRLCNTARSDRPVVDRIGRRLLDPTRDIWSEHFLLEDDHLLPKSPNGEYTAVAYNINDPRKVKLRKLRRISIERLVRLIHRRLQDVEDLHAGPRDDIDRPLARAREDIGAYIEQLDEYPWIPRDAPTMCRCDYPCQIPSVYDEQRTHLPEAQLIALGMRLPSLPTHG